jgi:hypothetical protein
MGQGDPRGQSPAGLIGSLKSTGSLPESQWATLNLRPCNHVLAAPPNHSGALARKHAQPLGFRKPQRSQLDQLAFE